MTTATKSASSIPRLSLSSAVAEKLREKIVRGEIKEGEQLRQDAIAAEFEVSRIPVREALRQLESEGLIRIVPHRGAVVSSLSPEEIQELFDIRALLECEVLKDSIPHLNEAQFARAEDIMKIFEQLLLREQDLERWGRLNWEFHSALYAAAQKPQFMSVIRMVNNNGERYTRLQLWLTHGIQRATEEHREILLLCRQRNVNAAVEALDRHIRHAGRSLKEFIRQRR